MVNHRGKFEVRAPELNYFPMIAVSERRNQWKLPLSGSQPAAHSEPPWLYIVSLHSAMVSRHGSMVSLHCTTVRLHTVSLHGFLMNLHGTMGQGFMMSSKAPWWPPWRAFMVTWWAFMAPWWCCYSYEQRRLRQENYTCTAILRR